MGAEGEAPGASSWNTTAAPLPAVAELPAPVQSTEAATEGTNIGMNDEMGSGPAVPAPTTKLGFDQGFDGWALNVVGGSESGHGSVTVGSAILHEGDSFLVSLERTFQVPTEPSELVFRFTDLHFDASDPAFINDAFEASLLNSDGLPLVHTIGTPQTAFFNITEDAPVALGAGTVITEGAIRTVTVDLSQIAAGTDATLQFRLVNNDADTETTVRILDVLVPGAEDAPQVTVALQQDTAPEDVGADHPYRHDALTNDATVQGTAVDDIAVALLEARVDDGPLEDITDRLVDGAFTFDPGLLAAGPHRITVVATDMSQQTTEAFVDFRVNQPPTARAGSTQVIDEGTTIAWDGSDSSDMDDVLHSYRWTFDDGSTSSATVVSRTYVEDGDYQATLTVIDTAGSQDTDSATITVHNLPAGITPLDGQSSQEGQRFPSLPVLPIQACSTPTPSPSTGATVSPIEAGNISEQNGAGTVSGSHVYQDDGTFQVEVSVIDDEGATATTRFQVTVANLPPDVLTAGDLTGEEGQPLDFLGTFSDPGVLDTHTAEIQWGDGTSSIGQISTGDGQAVVSGSHAYADNGNYTIVVQVTDNGNATSTTEAAGRGRQCGSRGCRRRTGSGQHRPAHHNRRFGQRSVCG